MRAVASIDLQKINWAEVPFPSVLSMMVSQPYLSQMRLTSDKPMPEPALPDPL